MSTSRHSAIVLGLFALAACQSFNAPLPPQPQPAEPPAQPSPVEPPVAELPPEVPPPVQPPPKRFRLSAASTALVTQAQQQARGGDSVAATATLERALRIEPDNPLLWIQLGRLRLEENNPAQAHSMGRKALALATGDGIAQASAWKLVGAALRAQGRNQEAVEAENRASLLLDPLSEDNDRPSPSILSAEEQLLWTFRRGDDPTSSFAPSLAPSSAGGNAVPA